MFAGRRLKAKARLVARRAIPLTGNQPHKEASLGVGDRLFRLNVFLMRVVNSQVCAMDGRESPASRQTSRGAGQTPNVFEFLPVSLAC